MKSRTTLALVAALAVALFVSHFVPYGYYLLYPFTLFATWVHECGHAITSVLLGGGCSGLHIRADASGDAMVTQFNSFRDGLVCAGGLLAPPLVGALLVVTARGPRRARVALGLFALLVGATDALLVRSIFGGIVLAALALVLGAVALRGGPRARLFLVQFLAVELGLDWLARLDYFFSATAGPGGATSDVATLAASAHHILPYQVWGALLAAISTVVLYLAVRFTTARDAAAVKA